MSTSVRLGLGHVDVSNARFRYVDVSKARFRQQTTSTSMSKLPESCF